MDRNKGGGMSGGGPKGMWRYLDGNDDLPQYRDRRSAAPQGNCHENGPAVVVITPVTEK